MIIEIKKFKWIVWTLIVLIFLTASCTDVLNLSDNVDLTNGVIELKIDNPLPSNKSKLITVDEYRVTSLLIVISDSTNAEIQRINWSASEDSSTYQIPVTSPGRHRVTVTHISNNNGKVVKAEESAYFKIKPMVITVVEILPGFVGFINIDASEQKAIKIVKNDILPVSLQETQAEHYILRREENVVPSGTIIREAVPEGASTIPVNSLTLPVDSYTLYVKIVVTSKY